MEYRKNSGVYVTYVYVTYVYVTYVYVTYSNFLYLVE